MLTEDQFVQIHPSLDPRQQALAPIIDAYKRRHRRVVDARFEDATQRMEVHNQWSALQQALSDSQECAKPLSAWASGDKSKLAGKKPKAQLRRLHFTLEILATKIQKVDELLEPLTTYDRQIKKTEQALDNASRALIRAVQGDNAVGGNLDDGDSASDASLANTSSFNSKASVILSPPMAPELVEFYKAVNNYKFVREHLWDLNYERQEQWDRRLLLADQDQPLEQTDEEFTAMWEALYVVQGQDREDAKKALWKARKSCMDAGITTPPLEDMEISEFEQDYQPRSPTQVTLTRASPENQSTKVTDDAFLTTDKLSVQVELLRQPLTAGEPSPLREMEVVGDLDDLSPSSLTPVLSDRVTEKVSQWIDGINLDSVNRSLERIALPSHDWNLGAATISNNDHRSKIRASRSLHSPTTSHHVTPRRTKALSLPEVPTFDMEERFKLLNASVRARLEPP
jgi:hypothetical protein